MNITKYPQSCVVLEKEGKNILIDPGSFMAAKFTANDLPEIDAIFLTHRHPDHADADFIRAVLGRKKVPVYANQDTRELLSELVSHVIRPSEKCETSGFKVEACDMPHCPLPDGSAGPPNNGYLFDGKFLHAGDSVNPKGIKVENAAIAIAGPDISLRDARDMILSIGAKKIIPIHYSIFSDEKPGAAVGLIEYFTPGIKLVMLDNGETASL